MLRNIFLIVSFLISASIMAQTGNLSTSPVSQKISEAVEQNVCRNLAPFKGESMQTKNMNKKS